MESTAVVVKCNDGKTFDLDEASALMSDSIRCDVDRRRRRGINRRFIVDLSDDPIPSEMVEKVIQYCRRQAHPHANDAFDFTALDQLELAKLAAAALKLGVQSLFDVAAGELGRHAKTIEEFVALDRIIRSFGAEFCTCPSKGESSEKSYLQSYKSVLNSKATEESLANFAWWEPGHGHFKLNHPWKIYLNVGCLIRQCACQIETLSGCIKSKSQVVSEFEQKMEAVCAKMSIECGKAMKELAAAIKDMRFPSSAVAIHLKNSKNAADQLRNIMENSLFPSETTCSGIMPIIVITSILIDIIKLVEKISVSVDELAEKAGFKELKSQGQLLHRGTVKPVDDQLIVEIV